MNYIEIPVQAEKILDTLHKAGFEAFVVGGCVRDSVLGGRLIPALRTAL